MIAGQAGRQRAILCLPFLTQVRIHSPLSDGAGGGLPPLTEEFCLQFTYNIEKSLIIHQSSV